MLRPWIVLLLCGILTRFALSADLVAKDAAAFAKCVAPGAKLTKLASGFKWPEGPVWFNDAHGGYLVFSDVAANEMKKWSSAGGLTNFRKPSGSSNGNSKDNQGRLVTCEQEGRHITLWTPDGKFIQQIVGKIAGKKFNSPNDVIVKSDGTYWFSDPPYGVPKGEKQELAKACYYRFDPATGKVTVLEDKFQGPNGLCFSPDEKKIYLCESWWNAAHEVWIYDVNAAGSLSHGKLFAAIDKGVPDGMRTDISGRLWTTAGDGIRVYETNTDGTGRLIGLIALPETPANLTFGGPDGKTLYITATTSLYSIDVLVPGAKH